MITESRLIYERYYIFLHKIYNGAIGVHLLSFFERVGTLKKEAKITGRGEHLLQVGMVSL